jgi:type IV pilus assembly protein PilY1
MWFIDPATGELIKELDDTTFNAPVTGGMAAYTGDVATIATRAFFTDDDGVMWRLDISSPTISEWDAVPFHDMFWDGDATDGQPSYYPPILSTDNNGRVVIIQATGRIDALDGAAANRVVSLTEQLTFDAADGTTDAVAAALNWEIHLEAGEQVTGPAELFESNVYFGTFTSGTDTTDACAYGFSRLWGVHYREAEPSTSDPKPGLDNDFDGINESIFDGPFENQVIMGVAVTQRPSCFEGDVVTDVYDGNYFRMTATEPGAFQLVAQVSGGGTRTAGGGEISEINRPLPPPQSFTLPQSWAGVVD